MKAYRVCWLLFCGVLGALGAVMTFTRSLGNVILLLVLAALTGAVVAMVALADPDGPNRSPRDRRRIVARSTALTAGGTASFIGLGTLVGAPTAVLLQAIMVGGSPYAIRYCLRRLSEHGHLASASPQPALPDRAARSLDFRDTQPPPGNFGPANRPHASAKSAAGPRGRSGSAPASASASRSSASVSRTSARQARPAQGCHGPCSGGGTSIRPPSRSCACCQEKG